MLSQTKQPYIFQILLGYEMGSGVVPPLMFKNRQRKTPEDLHHQLDGRLREF